MVKEPSAQPEDIKTAIGEVAAATAGTVVQCFNELKLYGAMKIESKQMGGMFIARLVVWRLDPQYEDLDFHEIAHEFAPQVLHKICPTLDAIERRQLISHVLKVMDNALKNYIDQPH